MTRISRVEYSLECLYGGERNYAIDISRRYCTCGDFEFRKDVGKFPMNCKHIKAVRANQ